MDNQRIEIKSSRKKNLLGLLVCLVFVMGSLFMITFEVNDNLFNRVLKNSIGYSGVLFFGGGVLISLFKGITSSPGLIIDEVGILVVASGQQIKWTNIKGLRVTQIASTRFISFDLNDPKRQFRKNKGLLKIFSWLTYQLTGTTTSISCANLDIKFDDLFRLINRRLISK